MTTDPFTEAAADAAVSSHDRELGPGFNGAYSGNYCIGFEQGAEWARTHLAAQEPTDSECITVLNAVTAPLGEKPEKIEWADAAIQRCREAMMTARAALSAARAGRAALAEGGEVR